MSLLYANIFYCLIRPLAKVKVTTKAAAKSTSKAGITISDLMLHMYMYVMYSDI